MAWWVNFRKQNMKTISDFKVHPAAALFPMIPEHHDDFTSLWESIKADGLLEPIVVDGDELIDGRNRLRACEVAGVEPHFIEWSEIGWGKSKARWIADKNFTRRHLTEDQKTMVWDELNPMIDSDEIAMGNLQKTQFQKGNSVNLNGRRGKEPATDKCTQPVPAPKPRNKTTVQRAAEEAGVSERKMRQAVKVRKAVEKGELNEDVTKRILSGDLSLNEAVKMIPRRQRDPDKQKAKCKSDMETVLKMFTQFLMKFSDRDEAIAIIKKAIE